MSTYRCFFFGPEDHLLDVDVASHGDDSAAAVWGARLLARGSAEYQAIEVWDRERLVCRVARPAPEPAASAPASARSAP